MNIFFISIVKNYVNFSIQCPRVAWQFQNPIWFPAVKQELILIWSALIGATKIRSMKNYLLVSPRVQCQIAIGGNRFTKRWRARTLEPGIQFDNFKPCIKSGVFTFTYTGWIVCPLGCDADRGFLKKEVKSYALEPMLTLYSPTSRFVFLFFFCFFFQSLGTRCSRYDVSDHKPQII